LTTRLSLNLRRVESSQVVEVLEKKQPSLESGQVCGGGWGCGTKKKRLLTCDSCGSLLNWRGERENNNNNNNNNNKSLKSPPRGKTHCGCHRTTPFSLFSWVWSWVELSWVQFSCCLAVACHHSQSLHDSWSWQFGEPLNAFSTRSLTHSLTHPPES